MKMLIHVEYADGSAVDTAATTADLVAFEDEFDLSIVRLEAELRLKHVSWLAWRSLARQGKTAADFDAWLDSIEDVTLADVEASPVPLEQTAPTSA